MAAHLHRLSRLYKIVIEVPVVDKFEALLASKQSPLCLFPTPESMPGV